MLYWFSLITCEDSGLLVFLSCWIIFVSFLLVLKSILEARSFTVTTLSSGLVRYINFNYLVLSFFLYTLLPELDLDFVGLNSALGPILSLSLRGLSRLITLSNF